MDRQPTPGAVVAEHIDALNNCSVDRLVSLAVAQDAVLVSGDGHLLGLADAFPVRTPAAFASMLGER